MGSVLTAIIGVVVLIGLTLAGFLFLGDRFTDSKSDSEAARFMTEGAQISHAYELYGLQEGVYPDGDTSDAKMSQIVNKGYLKSDPKGGRPTTGYATSWYIDEEKGAALTFIGDDKTSQKICIKAREQAAMPNPSEVKQCNASDITHNDPCCIAA